MTSRLPNLVVAGVEKAGTTSLYHYLAGHEQICPSDLKELNYFAPLAPEGGELESIERYERHFDACADQRYRMEASPSYCYRGQVVIEAIRDVLDEPRILISLRDPVNRFWSAYTFLQSMGRLESGISCDQYIDQCLDRESKTGRPTPLSVGRYTEWLPGWMDCFGDDLLLVFAEHLFSDPLEVVNEVLDWLDLDPQSALEPEAHNPTAQPRSRVMAKLAYGSKQLSDRLLASAPRGRAMLRNTYRKLNTRDLEMTMPDATAERLRQYYKTSNRGLGELLRVHGTGSVPTWVTEVE